MEHPFAVGSVVQHTNTQRRGRVFEVLPWRDGTCEYKVTLIEDSGVTQWSSRFVKLVEEAK